MVGKAGQENQKPLKQVKGKKGIKGDVSFNNSPVKNSPPLLEKRKYEELDLPKFSTPSPPEIKKKLKQDTPPTATPPLH